MPPANKFTKAQIIEAGLQLLREQGIEAVTARALAERLQSTPRPIFSYFSTMEEVKDALTQAAGAVYNHYIRSAIEEERSYMAVGLAYIRLAREEKQIFRLLFMSDCLGKRRYRQMDENMPAIFQTIARQAGITIQQAEALHFRMWIFTHGIASLLCTGACEISQAETEVLLIDAYKGLLRSYKEEKACNQ